MVLETSSGDNATPITKDFLEKVLKRKIVSFEVGGGSNPGDNFTSILFSVEIHLVDEHQPLYLLFKTFPSHPTRQKMLEDTNVFLKEFRVYNDFFPEMIRFQRELIGNDEILKPAVAPLLAGAAVDYENEAEKVNAELDPMLQNFLLMVDVRKTWGFKMADKMSSLDYHNVKVVMEELAKLHSLTYAHRVHKGVANNGKLFNCLEDPFFISESMKPMMDGMSAYNFQVLRNSMANFFKTRPEISDSIKAFEAPGRTTELLSVFLNPDGMDENVVEGLMRKKPAEYSDPPIKDQWTVTGHGDCWTNNMLFKSDDSGKVTDVVLVDLQVARDSCLMADLTYFIYTSTDTEFRSLYLNEMLELYYEKFVACCKHLKVEPFSGFTLENFKRKFHRSKLFGCLFACLVVPIILVRPGAAVDMDTVVVEKEGEGGGDDFTAMFKEASTLRDADDLKLLKERFTALFTELYEEGVL